MSPVLLDIVNFIGWIIFTITYREPKETKGKCLLKELNSTLFGMLLHQNSKHLKGQLGPL